MLLFTDVLTGDELCSDAYEPKTVDDVVIEVDCATVTIKDGEVNIGVVSTALQSTARADECSVCCVQAPMHPPKRHRKP